MPLEAGGKPDTSLREDAPRRWVPLGNAAATAASSLVAAMYCTEQQRHVRLVLVKDGVGEGMEGVRRGHCGTRSV